MGCSLARAQNPPGTSELLLRGGGHCSGSGGSVYLSQSHKMGDNPWEGERERKAKQSKQASNAGKGCFSATPHLSETRKRLASQAEHETQQQESTIRTLYLGRHSIRLSGRQATCPAQQPAGGPRLGQAGQASRVAALGRPPSASSAEVRGGSTVPSVESPLRCSLRTLTIPTRGFVAFLLSWLPPGLSSLVGSTLRVAGTGEGRITKRAPGRVGDDQRRAKCGIGKPIRFVLFLIAAWLAGTQVGDPDLIYCVYHLHGDSPYGVYFDSAFPQL